MGFILPIRLATVEAHMMQAHGEMRDLTLAEIDTLSQYVRQIVQAVVDVWPVDTGYSSSSFTWTIGSTIGEIGFQIRNDVHYAEYVHLRGTPAQPPLWLVLIPAVVRAFAPRINTAMRVAIDRTEAALAMGYDLLDLIQVGIDGILRMLA